MERKQSFLLWHYSQSWCPDERQEVRSKIIIPIQHIMACFGVDNVLHSDVYLL